MKDLTPYINPNTQTPDSVRAVISTVDAYDSYDAIFVIDGFDVSTSTVTKIKGDFESAYEKLYTNKRPINVAVIYDNADNLQSSMLLIYNLYAWEYGDATGIQIYVSDVVVDVSSPYPLRSSARTVILWHSSSVLLTT